MRPSKRGFPRSARLRRPAEFERVYARRRSAAGGPIVLHASPALEDGPPRLGLSVSRRVGNAVARNAWKRRLREAFREVRDRLPPGQDYVVVVRPAAVPRGAEGHAWIAGLLVELAVRIVARPASPGPPRREDRPRRRTGPGRGKRR